MDPITILSAFAPVVMDFGKSLINRFVAPNEFKPATIEQYAKMKEIDLEFFKVMNEAGSGNPRDRKSTRLNSSHIPLSRMPSSA